MAAAKGLYVASRRSQAALWANHCAGTGGILGSPSLAQPFLLHVDTDCDRGGAAVLGVGVPGACSRSGCDVRPTPSLGGQAAEGGRPRVCLEREGLPDTTATSAMMATERAGRGWAGCAGWQAGGGGGRERRARAAGKVWAHGEGIGGGRGLVAARVGGSRVGGGRRAGGQAGSSLQRARLRRHCQRASGALGARNRRVPSPACRDGARKDAWGFCALGGALGNPL